MSNTIGILPIIDDKIVNNIIKILYNNRDIFNNNFNKYSLLGMYN